MRVQLIAKHEKGVSGTGRYSRDLFGSLQAAGLRASLTHPAPFPPDGWLAQGLRQAGVDLQAFLSSHPLHVRCLRVGLYHITSQSLASLLRFQRFNRPVVVSILDVIPHQTAGQPDLDQARGVVQRWFRQDSARMLTRADGLVAISATTRQAAHECLGIPLERITVIHPSIDLQVFRPLEVPADFRARYGLSTRRDYILYVGSDDPRKNLATLIEAMRFIRPRHRSACLLVAGKAYDPRQQARLRGLVGSWDLQDAVKFLGEIPDADLPLLYNAARLLAFPSRYEGFGYPVLEALACGLPVAAADIGSVREICGPEPVLIPPLDRPAWVEQILALLEDEQLRAGLRTRGLLRAALFGRQAQGLLLRRMYESVIGGKM